MNTKITSIIIAFILLTANLFSQSQCGLVLSENFDDNIIPNGFSEIGTTGNVRAEGQRLVIDYNSDPQTRARIEFDSLTGSTFVNFTFFAERNWFLGFMYFLDSQGDTIAQVLLGNNASKALAISKEITHVEGTNFANMLAADINKNTDYFVSLNIDTDKDIISGSVDNVSLSHAQNIPLFKDAEDVESIIIHLQFIFGNESATDDIRFDDFNIINSQIDRSALELTIADAGQKIANATVGNNPGEFPQSAVDILQDSLDVAQHMLDSCQATQGAVDTAATNLSDAILVFLSSINKSPAVISVNPAGGHNINEGLSGYNMRIGDGPWNYDHPDFRAASKTQSPGFFRYFSGTRNNYIDHNTGMYEMQWHQQVHSGTSDYIAPTPWSDYKFMEGKGAHTIFRLNDMCGELGAKLVVTWNGFTNSPDDARNFAKFCKDNNIIVDSWQFVNEPNFYLPDRRYHWINGGDFVYKMKEMGMAIREVFPDADLAPSYGWDNFGDFSTSIKNYQDSDTAWWNTVSYHSYAIHGAGTDFSSAMTAANKMLNQKTSNAYFDLIDSKSWSNAKVLLTEVGTWNDYVKNKIYASVYMAEYFMRMSNQPQTYLIGRHHIADAVRPNNNYKDTIFYAFDNQYDIDENQLPTGFNTSMEGQAHAIINKAINNASAVFELSVDTDVTVPDNLSNTTKAIYAVAYNGMDSLDYILVTNKSGIYHDMDINISGDVLDKTLYREYVYSIDPEDQTLKIYADTIDASDLVIPPYCVMRIEYYKTNIPKPVAPRLYQIAHNNGSVDLKWWRRNIATSYKVQYGTAPGSYSQSINVDTNFATISGLSANTSYYFAVSAMNDAGESNLSNEVATHTAAPAKPVVNYVHEDCNRITLHWETVPYTNGYKVKYGNSAGTYTEDVDAGNVSGYVLRWLPADTDFYIVVEAYNGYGSGTASDEVSASTMCKRPWAPYLTKANEKTDGKVLISWAEPDSLHGGTYNVYYCPTPWNYDNYQLIATGVQNPNYTDTIPRKKGYHYYRVKAENEVAESFFFSNVATVNKVIDNSVGIIDVNDENGLVIYPNPANNKVIVKSNTATDNCLITIYSASGQRVMTVNHHGYTEINVESLSRGLYFIEMNGAETKQIQKLVIN